MQSKQKNFSIDSFGSESINKKIINYLLKQMFMVVVKLSSSLQSIENPDEVGLEINIQWSWRYK